MRTHEEDTIAAIATPPGEGAIAIVRVSGADSITAIDRLFVGKASLSEVPGYTIHFGKIKSEDGGWVDQVLVSVFRSPHSYTGEDSVEISCHGGPVVSHEVLAAVVAEGVRHAEPGEFTKRAFLNGKLDLSQAEAVADLIASKSRSGYRAALRQLDGRFSTEVRTLRDEILEVASLIELELDFSEEGLPVIPKAELLSTLEAVRTRIRRMIESYKLGRVYREGVTVAIVGKPNAGKSSLFNALLRENRAIVTEIPGTTRDLLEESISINGTIVTLSDTAGVRDTPDPIEAEGVRRAERVVANSDIVLEVVDASSLGSLERELISFDSVRVGGASKLILLNKCDLLTDSQRMGLESARDSILVSTKTGEGLEVLLEKITELGTSGAISSDNSVVVTSERQRNLLEKALTGLMAVEAGVESGLSGEFLASDIRASASALAEIIGEVTSDDLLNNIFKNFCIGK